MKYYFEKYYPIGLSFLTIFLLFLFRHSISDPAKLADQICENAISLSVTLVGFFLTILTLVSSIDSRRMRFVRDAGELPRVLKYLKQAINSNIVLIAISFLIKYFEHRKNSLLSWYGVNVFDMLYVFIFIFTILLSFRFTQIFVSLLADPRQESRD